MDGGDGGDVAKTLLSILNWITYLFKTRSSKKHASLASSEDFKLNRGDNLNLKMIMNNRCLKLPKMYYNIHDISNSISEMVANMVIACICL